MLVFSHADPVDLLVPPLGEVLRMVDGVFQPPPRAASGALPLAPHGRGIVPRRLAVVLRILVGNRSNVLGPRRAFRLIHADLPVHGFGDAE